MQALGAMRYVRAVEALAELHAYYQRGQLAEAALDALARIAVPASAPPVPGRDCRHAACRSSKAASRGWRALGDRGAGTPRYGPRSATNAGSRWCLPAATRELLLGGGSLDAVVGALIARSGCASRRSAIFSRSRRAARGCSGAIHPGSRSARADRSRRRARRGRATSVAVPIVEAMRRDLDPAVVRAAERALVRLRADTR